MDVAVVNICKCCRRPHHLPAGVLRVAGGEAVVGAVLQATLARHHRHLPEGAAGGATRRSAGPSQGYAQDGKMK